MADHVARDRAVTAVAGKLSRTPRARLQRQAIFVTIPSCPRVVNKAYTGIESEVGRQRDHIRMLLANFR